MNSGFYAIPIVLSVLYFVLSATIVVLSVNTWVLVVLTWYLVHAWVVDGGLY
jgi:hypothetical protein